MRKKEVRNDEQSVLAAAAGQEYPYMLTAAANQVLAVTLAAGDRHTQRRAADPHQSSECWAELQVETAPEWYEQYM